MLVLNKEEIAGILHGLSPEQSHEILDTFCQMLADYSTQEKSEGEDHQKTIFQPLRARITTPLKTTTLFMPSSTTNVTGIKVVSMPPAGGLNSALNIFNPTGHIQGLLNAADITGFRTALTSMIIFSHHDWQSSVKEPINVVVFGAGTQAEWHVRLALLLTPPGTIGRVTIINRNAERLEHLKACLFEELHARYPEVQFEVLARVPQNEDQVRQRLVKSNALFCCTPSTSPLFPYSYLEGSKQEEHTRYISMIGSYQPHMKEVDTATLLSGGPTIYVDNREACLEESGELADAKVTGDRLVEVGELLTQERGDRRAGVSPSWAKWTGTRVFKCVGMGIMDVLIGSELLRIAKEKGLGTEVPF
ncbi:NAD(P)-binding protein [Xylona heveae TC161]|uniref:NAD(P)-binding protein n=1 Tax=Xylona heveae (strain CBS 132557 / TC161) TaxID=1328760 RepID=A0A165GCH6_XYLHT|nr:NAD(P)-binding protein [Xylona heveae TC161]KZF22026.1 NAD(P)-binding protein [Xylona heveae TC161]